MNEQVIIPHQRLRGLLGVLLVATGMAACTASPRTVVVEPDVGHVQVDVGETLVVDLGSINPSIGDSWEVIAEPEPQVLSGAAYRTENLGGEGEVGGPISAAYAFEALAPGTTSIGLEYAYRGSTDPDEVRDRVTEPRPVIDVTVVQD